MFPEIHAVNSESPEWGRMWTVLSRIPINTRIGLDPFVCENVPYGESWQYMGTYLDGARFVHEFRHRQHPVTMQREIRKIPAPAGWNP